MKVDVKLVRNKLVVSKLLSKDERYKVTESKGMFQLAVYKEPAWVVGISSMCEDNQFHCLFLDYDKIARWIMEKDLERLSKIYGPFIVVSSKREKKEGIEVGNYQAINCGKHFPSEIIEIQRTTHCDGAYLSMPLRNQFRSWVLRTSSKGSRKAPKYLTVIGKDEQLDLEVSRAHYEWLKKCYKVPLINYKNIDSSKQMYKNVYETGNRLK